METPDPEHLHRLAIRKRTRKIMGFYVHLAVYLYVNLVILFSFRLNLAPESSTKPGFHFIVFVLWGTVVVIHAVSLFMPGIRKWESRKTEEFTHQYLKNQDHGKS
ncbi:2TM domain-containing protein [Chryseobacterium lacus]|uniref:2TM domain-containing protein n=1 Tax=Chryseobacterium lacus TaxID=2058346 RepID=A0A368N1K2_9FLAO|nr:2TM domain-containing protein [Chryseobacterium lacus]RCU43973.1 hypothetical protein DQ356_02835 [Chryseobacterium lacus]RST28902.1 2TM domain-containing protein [Chryseobacterium lacus]